MTPHQISGLACLLPADTTPEEAVKEAKELWEQVRKLKLDKAFTSYDLAKRAASIPGRLTIEQRIERVKGTYCAARDEVLLSGVYTKPAWGDDGRLPGLEEEERKINSLPFTEGMLTKDFLKLVLTKKKTHGDRLAIYRKFLREQGDFMRGGVSSFTKNQKAETTDNCPVEVRKRFPNVPFSEAYRDRFAVVQHAALFNLWFRADEKKTLSVRGSKGGKANAAKKNPRPKKKSLATKKPRKNSL